MYQELTALSPPGVLLPELISLLEGHWKGLKILLLKK
jgi:hypothetical protein